MLENVRHLMRRVAELEAHASSSDDPPSLGFSDDKLLVIAASMYRKRRLRARYFDDGLFGEPAWDMLLDLFMQRVGGQRISTTSLCLAANVPQATGLRWIGLLAEQDLLRRYSAPEDARLKVVELSPRGYQLMRRFLSDHVTRYGMPVPG